MAGGPYKGPGGWYFITWTVSGQQTKESLKTKSLPEAWRRKKWLEAENFNGKHDPFERKWYEREEKGLVTLAVAAKEYIRFKTEQKGRKGWKTHRTYKSHSNVILKFVEFADRIDEKTVHDFYHRSTMKSDYARVSYKSKIDAFLRWCKKQGYIDQVPEVEVDLPQTEIKEYVRQAKLKEIFTRMDEIAQMDPVDRYESKWAAKTDTAWYADCCRFAVGSGLRPIEVRQIQSEDISESDIYVGKSFRVKTNFQRKVPLDDPFAVEVVKRYKDRGPLFGRSSQKAQYRINRDLKQACRDVDSPVILTLKEFRHLYAIRYLIRNKADDLKILRLMQVMGHKQLSTTQMYLNYLPSDGVL